jgi:hypothetical protein
MGRLPRTLAVWSTMFINTSILDNTTANAPNVPPWDNVAVCAASTYSDMVIAESMPIALASLHASAIASATATPDF